MQQRSVGTKALLGEGESKQGIESKTHHLLPMYSQDSQRLQCHLKVLPPKKKENKEVCLLEHILWVGKKRVLLDWIDLKAQTREPGLPKQSAGNFNHSAGGQFQVSHFFNGHTADSVKNQHLFRSIL